MYEKEGIEVPADEQSIEFLKYNFPKKIEDDAEVFPSITRIPDAMIKCVNPTSSILMTYLASINPDEDTGILFAKPDAGSSKKSRKSKKTEKSTIVATERVEVVVVKTHA
ncbi:unnamed protein product [Lactuca saligna]|uniref:Uncharacterized protein n=1 Tax=Lactuca saligna TaxID=75948 RepID=A0AA35YWP5_LACSI|nr:unnamed protein product [Lactuca saligna]